MWVFLGRGQIWGHFFCLQPDVWNLMILLRLDGHSIRLKWLLLSSAMLLPFKHVFQLVVIVLSACFFTNVPTFTGLQDLPPTTCTHPPLTFEAFMGVSSPANGRVMGYVSWTWNCPLL